MARTSSKKRPHQQTDDGEARLAVNLPVGIHRALKRKAAERGIPIRTLILELLAKEGLDER